MKKLIYNRFEKSRINELELVTFPGKIVVVVSPKETGRCVDYLLSQPVLGFDTETRPSFKRGVHYACSLLQVSTEDCCFLFRLNYTGLTPDIVRLLEDTTVIKVGLSWSNDITSLHGVGEFNPGTFVELQDMARQMGIEDQSLVKLYANILGGHISKRERLSNWEQDILRDSQKRYAAIDAWACVKLYNEMTRLKETGDYELVIVPDETKQNDEEDSTKEG